MGDTEVLDLATERSDREDTDPRMSLFELQVKAIGTRVGELDEKFDAVLILLRKIARKIGVAE
jgi:hypothetical protein